MNNVVLPSWTLILPESWDESKPDFKGEVDGFIVGEREGEGRKNTPSRSHCSFGEPVHKIDGVFSVAFQDGGHNQCTSEFSLKNACSAGYFSGALRVI